MQPHERSSYAAWAFSRACRRRMAQGQAHAKMRAAALGLQDLDAAAVRVDEFGHHGKPDAGALDVAALRRFALIKRLEYAVALLGGNARAASP